MSEIISKSETVFVLLHNIYFKIFPNQAQISVLGSLLEDIHCRYALACSRLRELLSPLLQSETPNAAHMYCYLQRARDMDRQINFSLDTSNQKVFSAYQVCFIVFLPYLSCHFLSNFVITIVFL